MQGITKSTTIFSNKALLLKLLLGMQKHFCATTVTEHPENEMQLKNLNRRIYYTYRFILAMHITNALGFLAGALLTPKDSLPFECYRPEWLDCSLMNAFQNLVSVHTILIPVVSTDLIFMSVLRLTKIQFRLLCFEIEKLFDGVDNVPTEDNTLKKLKDCVVQHNFLLQ